MRGECTYLFKIHLDLVYSFIETIHKLGLIIFRVLLTLLYLIDHMYDALDGCSDLLLIKISGVNYNGKDLVHD